MKHFKLSVPDEVHKQLRIKCFELDVSMQSYIMNLVTDSLGSLGSTGLNDPDNPVGSFQKQLTEKPTLQRRKPKTTNPLSSPKPPPIIEPEMVVLSTGEHVKNTEWDWICSACTEAIARHDLPLLEFAALIEEHIAYEHPKGIGRRRKRVLGSKEMESNPNKEEDKQPWELY